MSPRPRTFVLRPDPPETSVSHEELQALVRQLNLLDDDRVRVTIIGNELHVTLTPHGMQELEEVGV